MKKLFLFCWAISLNLQAQLQWRPLPTAITNIDNQRFDDVFFLNENLGWAANGAYAAVYKTTDGGATWTTQITEQSLGGNYYFRNIEFLNENIGFLGTLDNVFFKTIDGGTTWIPVTNLPNAPRAVCGLDAVGESTVYGCGAYFSPASGTPAYIIKSTDSGATWQHIDMTPYATALVEILFQDENVGYASGADSNGGVILKTTDGGATWASIYNSGIPGEYVWKLQILSSNNNVLFGSVEASEPNNGRMVRSLDGGVNWIAKEVPFTSVQAIGFLTENHGWVGGYTSSIGTNFPFMETNDGGDTWTDAGVGGNLNRIFFLSDHLAYASGATIYKYSESLLSDPNFVDTNRVPLKVTVAPNPVKDKLSVSIDFPEPDHIVMRLYDATGKLLKVLKGESVSAGTKKYTFDFPYPSGTYFLNLHNDTGRQSVKFVK
ncbi:T9SS type A sorting domain-containing protein [Flavobacterium sp. CYK-4]|uniref:YCF48-related protein n=1 Tax=Flavobacterium lotistagni TaxID=2709660 RepID=UPI0014074B80|nr:YCF48-related protein [Flavobacterium lotistagni]NHM06361.1 T9SS type A sorting domain-containing protein [Flavobacterium lotistagni]